jgi:hypothetical protein
MLINNNNDENKNNINNGNDGRLCGLVVRVHGYKSGFDSRRYQIFW